MLRGEIAYRKGDHKAGFAKLRHATSPRPTHPGDPMLVSYPSHLLALGSG